MTSDYDKGFRAGIEEACRQFDDLDSFRSDIIYRLRAVAPPAPSTKAPTDWFALGHCPMYPGDGPACTRLEDTSECEDDCDCTSRLVKSLGLPAPSPEVKP